MILFLLFVLFSYAFLTRQISKVLTHQDFYISVHSRIVAFKKFYSEIKEKPRRKMRIILNSDS